MKKFTTVTLIIVLTLTAIGCDKRIPTPTTESKDATYSLSTSKNHSTSNMYPLDLATVTKYKDILNSAPVPTYIMPFDEYYKKYLSKAEKANVYAGENGKPYDYKKSIAGQHIYGHSIAGWPENFIFIDTNDNPHKIMAVYFHELGHNDCHTKRCIRCFKHGHKVRGELHAMIAELEKGMAHNMPEVVLEAISTGTYFVSDYDNKKKYADAVLEIYETELWDRVVRYLNYMGIETEDIPRSVHNKNCFADKQHTESCAK